MDIALKIKEKGLKKNWLAEKLRISPTRLSFYLNGDRPMPDSIKIELEKILS